MKNLNIIALEKIYLFLAIFIGLFMVFINPPFAGVPDENAHYWKTLAITQGKFYCNDTIISVPVNYSNLPDDLKPVKIQGIKGNKMSGSKIKEALITPASKEVVPLGSAICNASPIGYIPQAIGLKIGLLTNAPPLVAFYLGRFFPFVVVIFLIFSAIRIAPFGKIVFLLVGLLPMTMQQIASFSYDALHIGLILFFTAYILKLASSTKKLSKREMWLLFGLSLLALNAKPGYFFLAFLIFILPKIKFKNAKKYWLYTTGFALLNIGLFFLLRIVFNEAGAFGKEIDPNAQMLGVLKNPFGFLIIVIQTLYGKIMYFYETIVLRPGWMHSSLPDLLYLFYGLGFILLLRSNDEEIRLSRNQRLVLFFSSILQLIFVFFSLYLVWTKVGDDGIKGLQGRYLLVLLPIFILSFYKSKFTFSSEWIKNNIHLTIIIFLFITFLSVFVNFVQYYYKDIASYL